MSVTWLLTICAFLIDIIKDILLDENTTLKALFDKWPHEVLLDYNTDTRIPWQVSDHFQLSFKSQSQTLLMEYYSDEPE